MKLALIRRRFSATGGAEQYLQRLIEALVKQGHALDLFTEAWPEAPPGVSVHRLPPGRARAARATQFAAGVDASLRPQDYDCVFSLERTRRQDVYRAGDGVHRVWLERRRQFAPWWKRPWIGRGTFHQRLCALERETFDPARTGRIIVNSEMVRREIIGSFGFPHDRIQLVRNGVEVGRFRSGDRLGTRAELGVKEDEYLLLFVGSGVERKGLRFLLRALADPEIRSLQFRLLVVTRDRLGSTPPNVIVCGPRNDLEHVYAAADLFALLPVYEPGANVVFEALAAGLPVITSVFNGAAEILREGETGSVLADPSDPGPLRRTLLDWHRRWKAGGRRLNLPDESLSLERNLQETLAVLELAAAERKRGPTP